MFPAAPRPSDGDLEISSCIPHLRYFFILIFEAHRLEDWMPRAEGRVILGRAFHGVLDGDGRLGLGLLVFGDTWNCFTARLIMFRELLPWLTGVRKWSCFRFF